MEQPPSNLAERDPDMSAAFERALLARSESYSTFAQRLPTLKLADGHDTNRAPVHVPLVPPCSQIQASVPLSDSNVEAVNGAVLDGVGKRLGNGHGNGNRNGNAIGDGNGDGDGYAIGDRERDRNMNGGTGDGTDGRMPYRRNDSGGQRVEEAKRGSIPVHLAGIMRDADDVHTLASGTGAASSALQQGSSRERGRVHDSAKASACTTTDVEFAAERARLADFARALEDYIRTPADDHFDNVNANAGVDANEAMIRAFHSAAMAGDADYHVPPSRPSPRSSSNVTSGGPHAGSGLDEYDIEEETIDQGDTPFFLESPKMAKFDNFVEDEGMVESDEDEHSAPDEVVASISGTRSRGSSPLLLPKALADAAASGSRALKKYQPRRMRDWDGDHHVATVGVTAGEQLGVRGYDLEQQAVVMGGIDTATASSVVHSIDSVSPFALDTNFDYENVKLTHRLRGEVGGGEGLGEGCGGGGGGGGKDGGGQGGPIRGRGGSRISSLLEPDTGIFTPDRGDDTVSEEDAAECYLANGDDGIHPNDNDRASSEMFGRAKGHSTASPTRNKQGSSVESEQSTGSHGKIGTGNGVDVSCGGEGGGSGGGSHDSLVKMRCGKCSALLKIASGVPIFRCPKCAATLKVPDQPSKPQQQRQSNQGQNNPAPSVSKPKIQGTSSSLSRGLPSNSTGCTASAAMTTHSCAQTIQAPATEIQFPRESGQHTQNSSAQSTHALGNKVEQNTEGLSETGTAYEAGLEVRPEAHHAERAGDVVQPTRLSSHQPAVAREELQRHIDFSHSLEHVIDELDKQLITHD